MNTEIIMLYRPVGPRELALIAASGFREFPPRLPEQPIFYPVLNEEYANDISRKWNVRDYGAGYVTRFHVRKEFAAKYPVQIVGDSTCKELWVPAEELPAFNANIVGLIEVITEYKAESKNMKPILFYRVKEPFGEFSNFSHFPFRLNSREWPTTEHYFQAQKFAGSEYEEKIRLAHSPMIAARLGRSRIHPLRPDWEKVKEDIMRQALAAKFSQHPKLGTLLLSTGDAELVEHTKNDVYWGDGGDGTGKNRLGQLLMELRSQLRAELKNSPTR